MTAIANYFRLRKISRNEKLIMSYGGLRGAIAFALVLLVDPHHIPHKKLFVTSTLAVLYFTVFFQVHRPKIVAIRSLNLTVSFNRVSLHGR